MKAHDSSGNYAENLTLHNSTLEQIEKAHKDNSLLGNQYKSAKEFMRHVKDQAPLNKLYKVIASCNYNEDGDFCPVLVEIIDKKILQNNNHQPFLLQVWTKKGEMVFEMPLDHPVCNWNISNNKFVF